MTLQLKGRIDSSNAAQVEQELLPQLDGQSEVVLDAQELAFISSAGLRVILRIRKDTPSLRIPSSAFFQPFFLLLSKYSCFSPY